MTAPLELAADFDAWWAEYPRKVGKDAARRAYAKVRGRKDSPSAAALVLAVRAQAEGWSDPQYIPHPTTWLNQGRWNDDPRASARRTVPLTRRTETMEEYVARLQREHGGDDQVYISSLGDIE